MQTLDLNIPFGRTAEQEKNDKLTDVELAIRFITGAADGAFPQGFESGTQRRTFGRLQRKLDALEGSTVELEDAEADLLKKIFAKQLPFPPSSSKYVMLVEEAIGKLTD